MRTSGKGRSEWLLFVAPAALFGGFFLWMYGTPMDAVVIVDRFLVKILDFVIDAGAAVVKAISG